MANTPSSKKRARQMVSRNIVKSARRARIRGFVRKVEAAIVSGDKTAASEAFKLAEPELARGVSKGVLHKNMAARKLSRLSSRIAGLGD